MLALHYFLRSESSLDIIYKNIDHYLMDNGYVIFTFMDGKKTKFYKSRIGRAEIKLENNDAILHLFPNENYEKDED